MKLLHKVGNSTGEADFLIKTECVFCMSYAVYNNQLLRDATWFFSLSIHKYKYERQTVCISEKKKEGICL